MPFNTLQNGFIGLWNFGIFLPSSPRQKPFREILALYSSGDNFAALYALRTPSSALPGSYLELAKSSIHPKGGNG